MAAMIDANNLVTLLLGGGLVAIISVSIKGMKEWREGRTKREDTAIGRWQGIAAQYQAESEAKSETIAAYRKWYPRLWSAYAALSDDRDTYPTDPTQPNDEERKRP